MLSGLEDGLVEVHILCFRIFVPITGAFQALILLELMVAKPSKLVG